MQTTVLIVYGLAALVASLAGGSLPSLLRLTHTRLQTVLSFVAGLMLGMALLHLIPHATHATGSLDRTVQWAWAGWRKATKPSSAVRWRFAQARFSASRAAICCPSCISIHTTG